MAAGQSGTVTYVLTLPSPYTPDMNAFTVPFMIQDNGPGGLPIAQAQSLTLIGVPDLSIVQVILPHVVVPIHEFTATVIISNGGLGWACDPDRRCGQFYVDVFVDPVPPPPSYPYIKDGYPFGRVQPIGPGLTATAIITGISFLTPGPHNLYFKVDNFDCSPSDGTDPCLPSHSLGGLVPEYNEYNNVVGPVIVPRFVVYLPLIRKSSP